MYKQFLFMALMCNVFSLESMDASSPKNLGQRNWERRQQGKQKDANHKKNRSAKQASLNGGTIQKAWDKIKKSSDSNLNNSTNN